MVVSNKVVIKKVFPTRCYIYLDQFAVSNLAEKHEDWKEIGNLLERGIKAELIVCPLSTEHFIETAGKLLENALKQHQYFESISCGMIFKPLHFISAQILISTIRGSNLTDNTFLGRYNDQYSYAKHLNTHRHNKSIYDTLIDEATILNKELRTSRVGKMSIDMEKILINAYKTIDVNNFIERLGYLINNGGFVIRGMDFQSIQVPHWIDIILDILLKKHKMTLKEAIKLRSHLESFGFDKISSLHVQTDFYSYTAIKYKKMLPNDTIDFERIAAAIQVSDILVVDKTRKFEINELHLGEMYNTKIFSGTKDDLGELVSVLEGIVG